MFAKEEEKVKVEKELKEAQRIFYSVSENKLGYSLGY